MSPSRSSDPAEASLGEPGWAHPAPLTHPPGQLICRAPHTRLSCRWQSLAARVQQLLVRLRHNQLDAEHLLLSLLGEPDGLIKAAFDKLDSFQPSQLLEWL